MDARDARIAQEGADYAATAWQSDWKQDRYTDAFCDVMVGRGAFWDDADYDYTLRMGEAVRAACALVGVTPAARWAYVEGCLSAHAHEYADRCAEAAL